MKTAPRGVASLREHLGPLRVSRTVTLVDYCAANPDSAKRFAEGIGACLEEWLSDARVPKREFTISVLWRDDGWRDKLTIWREMARTAIGQRQDVTVQLRLHNDSDCLEKFPRVRFLLTEVAGAEVGKGFDVPEPTKGGDNTFGLLNFEAWISTRQKVNSYFPVEDRANLLE